MPAGRASVHDIGRCTHVMPLRTEVRILPTLLCAGRGRARAGSAGREGEFRACLLPGRQAMMGRFHHARSSPVSHYRESPADHPGVRT